MKLQCVEHGGERDEPKWARVLIQHQRESEQRVGESTPCGIWYMSDPEK